MDFHSKIKPKEDKFESYLKTPELQKLVNQAAKSYEDSGFLIENAALLTISKVASVFLGIVSVLCSVPMITNFLSLMVMGQKVIAPNMEIGAAVVVFAVLSLGFLSLMEIGKQKLAQKVAQTYWKKRTFSLGFLVFWLLMLGFSAWSAIEGSAEVAMFSAVVSPEKLENTGELARSYDSQIKDINKEISEVKKEGSGYTWNGALTEKGRAQIEKLNKQRDKLMTNKENSVNAAKLENTTKENNAANQGGKNANMVRFFVGMLELFILAACIYPQYYNYMVYMELKYNEEAAPEIVENTAPKIERTEVATTPPVTTEAEGKQAPTAKIGFISYDNRNEISNDNRNGQVECAHIHCKNTFTKNAPKHKYCSNECREAQWLIDNKGGKIRKGAK